jgi:hypothetical protein
MKPLNNSFRSIRIRSGGDPMTTKIATIAPWTTTAMSGATDTSPMELTALGDHLDLCRAGHGRLFAMRCAAESVSGFVSARFVSSLVAVVFLILAGTQFL